MILDPIKQIITELINEEVANMFAAPLAIMTVLLLISGLFLLFANSHTRRLIMLFVLITTLIFATFSMAKEIGFIRLPIDVTTESTQIVVNTSSDVQTEPETEIAQDPEVLP